jgi:hypothetical protein
VRNNNETVNWISMIVKNGQHFTTVRRLTLHHDRLPAPLTEKDIMSTTATNKVLTMLKNYIEKGFSETKAEFQPDQQPY